MKELKGHLLNQIKKGTNTVPNANDPTAGDFLLFFILYFFFLYDFLYSYKECVS